jgi:hypothetical protein
MPRQYDEGAEDQSLSLGGLRTSWPKCPHCDAGVLRSVGSRCRQGISKFVRCNSSARERRVTSCKGFRHGRTGSNNQKAKSRSRIVRYFERINGGAEGGA